MAEPIVIPALGVNETASLTAPVEWHDRIRQLAPFCQYGPSYDRGIFESLRDMSMAVQGEYTTVAYDYLVAAEKRAGLANPTPEHMTAAQAIALRALCERYHVEFNGDHYQPQFDLPDGYVAGWVGGPDHSGAAWHGDHKHTIFVGCSPEGGINS